MGVGGDGSVEGDDAVFYLDADGELMEGRSVFDGGPDGCVRHG